MKLHLEVLRLVPCRLRCHTVCHIHVHSFRATGDQLVVKPEESEIRALTTISRSLRLGHHTTLRWGPLPHMVLPLGQANDQRRIRKGSGLEGDLCKECQRGRELNVPGVK